MSAGIPLHDLTDEQLRAFVGQILTVRVQDESGVIGETPMVLLDWHRRADGSIDLTWSEPLPARQAATEVLEGTIALPTWSSLIAGLPEPALAIAKLHRPVEWIYSDQAECRGCEMGVGHGDRDYPNWPCDTAVQVLHFLDIDPMTSDRVRVRRAGELVAPEPGQ